MVFDNLGLDADDLGAGDLGDDLDLGSDDGQDDGDQQSGDDGAPDHRGRQQQLDDLSVSRTPDRRQQRQQPEGQPRPFARSAEVQPDGNGNLVDPHTGQVVARAGREAALYQRGFKSGEGAKVGGLTYRLQQRENQLRQAMDAGRQLHTEVQQLRSQGEALKQFNLQPNDMLAAAKLFNDLKTRPAEALRALLTRAAASGTNVAELGIQGVNGADAKSLIDLVREEIQKATQPISEQNQRTQEVERQRQQQQEQERKAHDEVESFFAENQDAQKYMPVFQRVLQNPDFRGMSLGEIWARIQLNLLRNGSRQGGSQRGNARGVSRPVGRGQPPSGDDRNRSAPANSTYDSILKDVLDQHGIQ